MISWDAVWPAFTALFFPYAALSPPRRNLQVYYKTHIGAYGGCGRHFGAACSLADAQGVPGWAAIGVYFDDPGQVAGDKCRYLVGIRAPDGDSRLDTAFRTAGYSIVDLPATRAVHATFPFTGLLSILLGVRRVYPALGQHNKEAGPFVELTDPRGKITEYYGMLENSSVFMVGLQDMATYAKNNPRK